MGLQVTCTGMTQGTPPDPCLAVIFGASGDLAQNTLPFWPSSQDQTSVCGR
jgi:hypothetical protein